MQPIVKGINKCIAYVGEIKKRFLSQYNILKNTLIASRLFRVALFLVDMRIDVVIDINKAYVKINW